MRNKLWDRLDYRDAEICEAMIGGLKPTEIGNRLSLNLVTVKQRLRRIYLRMGIGDRWAKSVRLVYLLTLPDEKICCGEPVSVVSSDQRPEEGASNV